MKKWKWNTSYFHPTLSKKIIANTHSLFKTVYSLLRPVSSNAIHSYFVIVRQPKIRKNTQKYAKIRKNTQKYATDKLSRNASCTFLTVNNCGDLVNNC